jgi:hypothetical protein
MKGVTLPLESRCDRSRVERGSRGYTVMGSSVPMRARHVRNNKPDERVVAEHRTFGSVPIPPSGGVRANEAAHQPSLPIIPIHLQDKSILRSIKCHPSTRQSLKAFYDRICVHVDGVLIARIRENIWQTQGRSRCGSLPRSTVV